MTHTLPDPPPLPPREPIRLLLGQPEAYWQRVRRFYMRHEAAICRRADDWGFDDPYAWLRETGIKLSDAQAHLWQDIRGVDAVLYPHYPVGPHAVDFASPACRVAILILKSDDPTAGIPLLEALEEMGWKGYQIEASACAEDTREIGQEDGGTVVATSRPHDFIREICARHPIARGGSGRRFGA